MTGTDRALGSLPRARSTRVRQVRIASVPSASAARRAKVVGATVFPVTGLVDGDTGKVMILDDGIAVTYGAKAQRLKASGSGISSPRRSGAGPGRSNRRQVAGAFAAHCRGPDFRLPEEPAGHDPPRTRRAQPSCRCRKMRESWNVHDDQDPIRNRGCGSISGPSGLMLSHLLARSGRDNVADPPVTVCRDTGTRYRRTGQEPSAADGQGNGACGGREAHSGQPHDHHGDQPQCDDPRGCEQPCGVLVHRLFPATGRREPPTAPRRRRTAW